MLVLHRQQYQEAEMVRRPVGRPRREMRELDRALADYGGVRVVVEGLVRSGHSNAEVLQRLAALAPEAARPRCRQTISNWLRHWEQQDRRREGVLG